MPNYCLSASIKPFCQTLGVLVLACGVILPANAAGTVFTFDPAAIGISASPLSGDALKATEVSHIQFTDNLGDWTEHGYAKITGVLNNGVFSSPSGLNSSFSLYLDFHLTGNIGTGQIFTANETLYAVSGASIFGIDSNNDAFVDNGSFTAVAIATSNLISGLVGSTVGGDLFAKLYSSFAPVTSEIGFFSQPQPFPSLFYGDFFHSISEPGGVQPELIAGNLVGFVVKGGDDTLSLVPEPGSPMLLLLGFLSVVFVRGQKFVRRLA